MKIIAHEEEKLNLLGLILKNYFTAISLGDNEKKKKILNKITGTLSIKAGEMGAYVSFKENIIISNLKDQTKNDARLSGNLAAFVGIMAKKGFIRPVLNRKIQFGGNVFLLLKLLKILL